MDNTRKGVNALSFKVVGAAIEVHKHLGPGLLEAFIKSVLHLSCWSAELTFNKR